MANRGRLKALMEARLAERSTAEWEAELIPQGVPCSAINDVAEMKARHPEAFVPPPPSHPPTQHGLQPRCRDRCLSVALQAQALQEMSCRCVRFSLTAEGCDISDHTWPDVAHSAPPRAHPDSHAR